MRVFVNGGTGFIGAAVARQLLDRGDGVVALVRTRERGAGLARRGAELALGQLADERAIRTAAEGCDAVIHAAGIYAIGVPIPQRPAMYRTNVLGTERVLRAAAEAHVPRVVHVSTVNALGNTEGRVVDETHRHSGRYVSYYDETKHLAHEVAVRAIAEGQDVVIAMPGVAYGPGDNSTVGNVLQRFLDRRLPVLALADVGVTAVHRDDVAAGILACLDRGGAGEAYVLGGEITTLRGMVAVLAAITGRRPPRVTVPATAMRLLARLGPRPVAALGLPENLAEAVTAADRVTYWASSGKATARWGYAPRSLVEGLRTLVAPPTAPQVA